jgi:hypothetical protein
MARLNTRINTRSYYCCCAVFLAAAAAANLYVADRELDQLLQKGCACVCVYSGATVVVMVYCCLTQSWVDDGDDEADRCSWVVVNSASTGSGG